MKSALYFASSIAATLTGLALALPDTPPNFNNELRTVHQFPNLTWIENFAIRSNGQIVATDVAGGRIFLVDPKSPQAEPPVIYQFPENTAIAGITEVEDDVFYTAGSHGTVYNFTFTTNTSAVWEVDMRHYDHTKKVSVRKVTDITKAIVPNGVTTLSKQYGTILVGDAEGGVIWKVDVKTGAHGIAIDDPYFKPNTSVHPPFGVNGIHIIEKQTSKSKSVPTLYFSNTSRGYLGFIPICPETGKATGNATLLSDSVHAADDFTVDSCGNVWLAENVLNTLVRVFPDGHVQTIAGGPTSTALIGPVAVAFGRGCDDRDVLYISTDGYTVDANQNPLTTNGKIAAIDVRDV
ncbi:hypothetical protein F5884DRAFT_853860 [Xylogone sp. PMI_703]|nr:hypothetical protein F5884DRAFT_853860 [Xylogone sp. PMI_703]